MERNAKSPRMGRPGEGLNLNQVLALSASFFLGIALMTTVANVVTNDGQDQLARAVGEPSQAFDGASVIADVAGVVCDTPPEIVGAGSDAGDLVGLWNAAVQSSGDACTPAFAPRLGEIWMMSDPIVSVVGADGSLYEIRTEDGALTGLSLFLVAGDADDGRGLDLQGVITHVWGEENIDWNNDCSTSDAAWVGVLASDGSDLSVRLCAK